MSAFYLVNENMTTSNRRGQGQSILYILVGRKFKKIYNTNVNKFKLTGYYTDGWLCQICICRCRFYCTTKRAVHMYWVVTKNHSLKIEKVVNFPKYANRNLRITCHKNRGPLVSGGLYFNIF